MKDQKQLSVLLKQILIKIQSEDQRMTPSIFLWLRELLKQHWQVVLLHGSKQDFATLSALKQLLVRKSQLMQTFLQLKGKIEMVTAMSVKPAKQEADGEGEFVTYKDYSSDEEMASGEDSEDDEEIK